MLFFLIGLIIVVFLWKLVTNPKQIGVFLGRWPKTTAIAPDILFMLIFSIFGLCFVLASFWILSYVDPKMTYELIETLDSQTTLEGFGSLEASLALTILIGIVAPFFEEVLFRGVILRFLASRGGVITGLVLSALVFGFMHGAILFISTALSGMLLGIVFLKYNGSVLAAFICHAINNTVATIGEYLSQNLDKGKYSDMVWTNFSSEYYFYLTGLAITLPLVIYYFRKNWKHVSGYLPEAQPV